MYVCITYNMLQSQAFNPRHSTLTVCRSANCIRKIPVGRATFCLHFEQLTKIIHKLTQDTTPFFPLPRLHLSQSELINQTKRRTTKQRHKTNGKTKHSESATHFHTQFSARTQPKSVNYTNYVLFLLLLLLLLCWP